jgi:hypothetical protein
MKTIENIFSLAESFSKLASSKKEKIPPRTNNINEILKNLQKLETFQARMDYAEKNLKHLSSGSSRVVFDLQNNNILKLASNEKGLAQNEAESSVKEDCKYINPVVKAAKNKAWVICPKGDKITEREFFDLTDISFKDFGECLKYIVYEDSSKKEKPKDFDKLKKNKIVKEVSEIASKYKLVIGDVARISSWKVIDGVPTLVDLGLNESIYKEYYAKSNKS